jgi:hypothetical protein
LSLWFLGAEAVLCSSAEHLGNVHQGVAKVGPFLSRSKA